jgi:hypothetical protein
MSFTLSFNCAQRRARPDSLSTIVRQKEKNDARCVVFVVCVFFFWGGVGLAPYCILHSARFKIFTPRLMRVAPKLLQTHGVTVSQSIGAVP